ncbi:MAG: DUF4384 domain-containing protein [Deltaproteobacteria bacterium]|jgi:hypothetical protein
MKNSTTYWSRICKPFPGFSFFLYTVISVFLLSSPMNVFSQTAAMGAMGGNPENGTVSESWSWGDMDLDKAVFGISDALVQQGRLKGKPVLISPNDLYDATSGLSLPLAPLLRGKLMDAMKARSVRVMLPGADAQQSMILQGTWQKEGNDLNIHIKILSLKPEGPEAVASASARVPLKEIDQALLVPDRESWARYLVRKLERNTTTPTQWTVYVGAFNVKSKKCNPELGAYLSGWIQPAMAQSRMFVPLDQKRALRGLSVNTLRKRGTRAIRPQHAPPDQGISLTADLMNADGEIKGKVWRHKDRVEVQVKVVAAKKNQQVVTAAAVEVPSELFPPELLQPPESPTTASPPGTTPGGKGHVTLSKDGLTVELTTTRGEGKAYYSDGERIRFVLRLNRSATVYLFDLDPQGNATLLYPVDETGRLARENQCGARSEPGTPIILPEDGCSYDLVVTKPYGRDTVWAVAAETPLRFPPDLKEEWRKADILVKRLRAQGLSGERGYAESEVEVVTGP